MSFNQDGSDGGLLLVQICGGVTRCAVVPGRLWKEELDYAWFLTIKAGCLLKIMAVCMPRTFMLPLSRAQCDTCYRGDIRMGGLPAHGKPSRGLGESLAFPKAGAA